MDPWSIESELAIFQLDERHLEIDIIQREKAAAQLESQRIGLIGEIEIGESGVKAGDIRFQFKASHIETLKTILDSINECIEQNATDITQLKEQVKLKNDYVRLEQEGLDAIFRESYSSR